jgi:hypothetical protein
MVTLIVAAFRVEQINICSSCEMILDVFASLFATEFGRGLMLSDVDRVVDVVDDDASR